MLQTHQTISVTNWPSLLSRIKLTVLPVHNTLLLFLSFRKLDCETSFPHSSSMWLKFSAGEYGARRRGKMENSELKTSENSKTDSPRFPSFPRTPSFRPRRAVDFFQDCFDKPLPRRVILEGRNSFEIFHSPPPPPR